MYPDDFEEYYEPSEGEIFFDEMKEKFKEILLKRDYSDKLFAYTCNLLELYSKYFEKSDDYIGINIHMNGDKCFGGKGYIES